MTKKLTDSLKAIWKKGLVHILAGNFMTKLVSMFGSIFLVRILSKEEYGVLGYLDNIYGYVLVMAGMGMANTILRYVVLGKTREEKYGHFRYAFGKGLVWNLGLCLAVAVFFSFYPHKQEYRDYAWLLNIMFIMLPLQNITEMMLCNERAMFANQRYAFFSLTLSIAVIVGKITTGAIGGIRAVVFGQLTVYGVMAVVMTLSGRKQYYRDVVPQMPDRAKRREEDRYALQYMITNGLWTVFMLNDTFLLGRFCDPSTIADYRVAYTIPGCVSIISSAIGVFVAPYFVRNENDAGWIRKQFKLTYLLSSAAVGLVCLTIAVLAKPVVWLLYGQQYLNVVPVMRLLLLASFFNCGLRYTTANLLAAMGQIKYNMAVSVLGMVLQVGVNILIVPRYGAPGVAMTSCVVYLIMAICLFVVFVRKYFSNKV